VEQLRRKQAGSDGKKSGRGRPQVGVKSVPSRATEIAASADENSTKAASAVEVDQNALLDAVFCMTMPNWQDLVFDKGILREPCPGDNRLVLWLAGSGANGFQHWERVRTIAGAKIAFD
jgi:hypothetical protein